MGLDYFKKTLKIFFPGGALYNKIRRFILCKFRRDYIETQTLKKIGDCRQCGKCCRLLFTCPFLVRNGDNIRCLIYEYYRPWQCIAYPIDGKDLEEIKFDCGYSFID